MALLAGRIPLCRNSRYILGFEQAELSLVRELGRISYDVRKLERTLSLMPDRAIGGTIAELALVLHWPFLNENHFLMRAAYVIVTSRGLQHPAFV